jgi:hypothetical protein
LEYLAVVKVRPDSDSLTKVPEEAFASFGIFRFIGITLEKLEDIHWVILCSFSGDGWDIDADPPLHHSFSQQVKITVPPSDGEWPLAIDSGDAVGKMREAILRADLWVLNCDLDLSGVVD